MSRRVELVGGPQDGLEVELSYDDTTAYNHSPKDNGHYESVDKTRFFRWVPNH